jgi:hypothetical protein
MRARMPLDDAIRFALDAAAATATAWRPATTDS